MMLRQITPGRTYRNLFSQDAVSFPVRRIVDALSQMQTVLDTLGLQVIVKPINRS